MLNILKTYFSPFPFLLLCLYVFFMFTAQETLLPTVIHSAVMYCMIGAVAVYALLKKKASITGFSIWYSVFFLFCIFSAALYPQSDPSILFPIVVSLIISFCFIQLINSTDKLEACLNIYVISAVVMALMLWQTGQLDYLYIDARSEMRLGTEVTGNANIFTALFMYSGVFAAWFMVYEKKKMYRLIYLLAFVFILFIMIASGGRKTIIAIMGALGVFLVMKESGHKKKIIKNTILAIAIVAGIFVAILKVPILYDLIGERFEGLFDFFTGKGSNVSSDDTRGQIFVLALKGWLEQPLLGHGIDSFKSFNRAVTGHFYYAHNNFAELLYDVGIVGFALFYYMFVYIYKRLKLVNADYYKYKILGYGLLVELLIFDVGGVSYYLVGNIVILAITYLCITLQKT